MVISSSSKSKGGISSLGDQSSILNFTETNVSDDLPSLTFELLIKSGNLSARIPRLLANPKQNKMPSKILLFPEPFGPVTTVKPSSRGIFTLPPKDLKFSNST